MKRLQKGNKKLLKAWAFYDWANSVYSLVITSAVFPVFYGALTLIKDEQGNILNDTVVFLGLELNNDSLISYVTGLAFIVVSVLSPFLSGIADYAANKKNFMRFFCYMGAVSCMGLFWFNLDYLWLGLSCYFLALIGFWGSLVFYNSYLPDIAFPKEQDKLSARGYSLGYVGSVILLLICLGMIMFYEELGFPSQDFPTRLSFILTGLWWIGFSQYSFYYLPKGNKKEGATEAILLNGFRELKKIFKKVKKDILLRRYLSAFFVYSMAVQTIMLVATYFGIEELEWGEQDPTTGLIISILLIQLIAVLGAFLTAKAAKKYGNFMVLLVLNFIWIGVCIYAFFITLPLQFYVAAAIVGLVMGGTQALSRSTYSKLIPEGSRDTTSFFSFYDVCEKIGIFIGMFSYGFVVEMTGSIRYSVLFLVVFFIVGAILLLRCLKLRRLNKFV